MSARADRPLPRFITDFLIAVEGFDIPTDVHAVLLTIARTWRLKNPITALNRGIGQFRRQRGRDIFLSAYLWFTDEPVRAYLAQYGAGWTCPYWRDAMLLLYQGKTAGKAFGLDKPGRNRSMAFNIYEDAALLAEARSLYEQTKNSTKSVIRLRGFLDEREVRRQRKKIRSMGIPDNDIAEQSRLVKAKYYIDS